MEIPRKPTSKVPALDGLKRKKCKPFKALTETIAMLSRGKRIKKHSR